jgi:hypothetical protein
LFFGEDLGGEVHKPKAYFWVGGQNIKKINDLRIIRQGRTTLL